MARRRRSAIVYCELAQLPAPRKGTGQRGRGRQDSVSAQVDKKMRAAQHRELAASGGGWQLPGKAWEHYFSCIAPPPPLHASPAAAAAAAPRYITPPRVRGALLTCVAHGLSNLFERASPAVSKAPPERHNIPLIAIQPEKKARAGGQGGRGGGKGAKSDMAQLRHPSAVWVSPTGRVMPPYAGPSCSLTGRIGRAGSSQASWLVGVTAALTFGAGA
jgi:hypothetical protein